jgi:hypothetical protein
LRPSKGAGIDGLGGSALDVGETFLGHFEFVIDPKRTRFLVRNMDLRALVLLFYMLEPFAVLLDGRNGWLERGGIE